jgi:hypothetical protein
MTEQGAVVISESPLFRARRAVSRYREVEWVSVAACVADCVEKVPSGGAAQISLNRNEIYNRLLIVSQFYLERSTSRPDRAM